MTSDNDGGAGAHTGKHGNTDVDKASGLPIGTDSGTTDLGDDVQRDVSNRGSVVNTGSTSDIDKASGLPINIDPGTTDLGDDVYRSGM